MLDLTDGSLRRSLGVSEKRLLDCDWRAEVQAGAMPIPQELGRAVYLARLEAMLVRSAADASGRNLVAFVDNIKHESFLRVVAGNRRLSDA